MSDSEKAKEVKKRLVLACSMDEECLKNFDRLKKLSEFADYEWHFIHIHPVQFFINYQAPYVYPDESQKKAIAKATEEALLELKNKLVPDKKDVVIKCMFSPDPTDEMTSYLEACQAQLVAVSTRPRAGIKGLFRSSFAEAMSRFAPCDVLVLRPL